MIQHASQFITDLRQKTASQHSQLDSLPLSKCLLSDSVTKAEYAEYLSLMRPVIASVEKTIFPKVATFITDIESRRKRSAIDADLHHLQQPFDNNNTLFNGNYSEAFALGIVYVVEGSSLGGLVILRNISNVLGLTDEGTQYFQGYGKKTGNQWREFLMLLADYEEKHECGDEIIAGANYAFETIHNHLSQQ